VPLPSIILPPELPAERSTTNAQQDVSSFRNFLSDRGRAGALSCTWLRHLRFLRRRERARPSGLAEVAGPPAPVPRIHGQFRPPEGHRRLSQPDDSRDDKFLMLGGRPT